MKFTLIASVAVATVVANDPYQTQYLAMEQGMINMFSQWKVQYNKSYHGDEHGKRYAIFKQNLADIAKFNVEKSEKLGWKKGINKFSDLTAAEFKSMYLGQKRTRSKHQSPNSNVFRPSDAEISAVLAGNSVDWRTKGAVTAVKDQGQCGSCWSFSTTGALEGFYKISGHPLVSFSEQNLIDCSTKYGNQGCNGGDMGAALQYVIDNKGIDTEDAYPYTATGPNDCQYTSKNSYNPIKSYSKVPSGDETALAAAIAKTPVSVGIDASELQSYSSGVYAPEDCSSVNLDHGVLAIGYGQESDGTKFYWVKNSWSDSWGLDGYFKLGKDQNNMCGIATDASFPSA